MTAPAPRSPVGVWLLVLLVLGAALALLFALRPILAPFVVGALLAYLGDPLVDRLERHRCNRTGGVLLVFTALALLITVVSLVTVPLLIQQLDYLVRRSPEAYQWLVTDALPRLQSRFDIDTVFLASYVFD